MKPKPEADRLLRRRCMFTKASCRRYAILKGFYLLLETLLFRIGGTLVGWGYKLEQHRLRDVPKCPDCGIGPDVGDNCPVCLDKHHTQQADRDLEAWAYNEGYAAAERHGEAA